MTYELVLIYGIIAIIIGIVPAISFAFWRFGLKKEPWYSWLLGGLFWALSLIIAMIPIMILRTIFETTFYFNYINYFIIKVFETAFRVLLFIIFTKFTADTSEKVIMAGLGWATFRAIFNHTIPFFFLIIFFWDNKSIVQMDRIEYLLLFGGYNHFLAEVFQSVIMVMIFYGIKGYLNIENSEPIKQNFFSKDPKPVWIWIVIGAVLHIFHDNLFLASSIYLGFYMAYIIITLFIGVLVCYILKRIKVYPLFNDKSAD
ncbi:MAG: hypothetical protein ACFFAH_01935 [Promethearchaeota archaeon]